MAVRCEYVIAQDGGLARTDLPALNRSLRRNINSSRGYQQPIDLTTQRLSGQHHGSAIDACASRVGRPV